jgi:phosphatidylglycerol:prolipoprotein diacylglycerol transferase
MHPILFEISNYPIRTFPILCAIGVIWAIIQLERDITFQGFDPTNDKLSTLLLLIFFGALAGGRITYIVIHPDQFNITKTSAFELIRIWRGGGDGLGALLGGTIVLYLYCLWNRLNFIKFTDTFALPATIVQFMASIGSFMNGELHGTPTQFFTGIIFPYGPASLEFPGTTVHPNMLYAAAIYLLIGLILHWCRCNKYKLGFTSAIFILLNSLGLFVLSFFKLHPFEINGSALMPIFSLLSITMAAIVILILGLYEKD